MEDKKKQELVKKCIDMASEVEDVIQCPLCFETTGKIVQCTVGHHICEKCKIKVGDQCPSCRGTYSGTKCFVVEDVAKVLSKVKISLTELDKCVSKPNLNSDKNDMYRKLVETLLNKLTAFLSKSSNTLQFFSAYLQNPNNSDHKKLEEQLISLTTQFHNVRHLMDDTKHTLNRLKK